MYEKSVQCKRDFTVLEHLQSYSTDFPYCMFKLKKKRKCTIRKANIQIFL